jgi:hypothetical protein
MRGMLLSISGLLFFSLAAFVSAGEAEMVKLKPDAGELTVVKVEKPNKPPVLETVFPIQPTEKKSFIACVTMEITKWRTTGIHAGFRNSKNNHVFEVWLQDDHMGHGSASMNVFMAEGWGLGFQGTFCQMPFDTRNITVVLMYEAPLGRFKAKVCDTNDRKKVFGESEWAEVKGFFTVDQFFVRAMALPKDKEKEGKIPQPGSSVKWDQASNGVRVFSQVGSEDVMEALIKKVTLQTEE